MGLRIIMAVGSDGYVARGPGDDMSWTGGEDKAVFRLLTSVGGVIGVGKRTRALMPERLPGRQVLSLTRHPSGNEERRLDYFASAFPDAWLAGGQTVALAALEAGWVGAVYLCHLKRPAFGPREVQVEGVPDQVTTHLLTHCNWSIAQVVQLDDLSVRVWKKLGARGGS